jgi:hypothetical protein
MNTVPWFGNPVTAGPIAPSAIEMKGTESGSQTSINILSKTLKYYPSFSTNFCSEFNSYFFR